jgi:putative Ca2+/H+ antiporter (TMEM165/GDT1 family)
VTELLMNFLSVVIGYEISGSISIKFFELLGMIFFTGFGIFLLFEIFSEEEDHSNPSTSFTEDEGKNLFYIYLNQTLKISSMIFLSELGDKSQITTIFLSSKYDPLWVFLGTSVAHVFVIAISIFLGYLLSNKISKRSLMIIGAITFILFGVEMGVKYMSSEN